MMRLALPTPEAIEALRSLPSPIVEIGSGDGLWHMILNKCGIVALEFDKLRGEDHTDAAEHDGSMLAVWPPDGPEAQRWALARAWKAICIVADFRRLDLGDALSGYALQSEFTLPAGRKGPSTMKIYGA